MRPVWRFAALYLCALLLLFALGRAGLAAWTPMLQPPVIVLAAFLSGGTGVVAALRMLIALVVINVTVTLGFAGLAVLPDLLREFLGAPLLLSLWMLSSLILPGLLIAGGVWTRHMVERKKERAP